MNPEIISQPLSLPAVARAAMQGDGDPRYEKRPRGGEEWAARARAVNDSVPGDWASQLQPALSATGEAAVRLARVAGGKGIVVTTGQQPGLFGGPIYTLSKALSALAFAGAVEKLTGIPTAPVFWAATDDTDFREASKTAVAVSGGARELVMDPAGELGSTMAQMPLGDVTALVAELAAACGSGADPSLPSLVRELYSASNTVGGAYVELLRALFAPLGISVLDASHDAVRRRSAPVIRLALERADDIATAISANNSAIEREGHALQVQDVAGLSLVFETTPTGRKRIPRKRGARDIAAGADLGPNVLLRPVVERQILPTIAYVGGPAEIAYFSQLGPIADTIGVPRPLIVPRWSCTIVEPHVRKMITRLGAAIHEFQDPHAVETKIAREKLPDSVQRELASFRRELDSRAASLSAAIAADSPLAGKAVVDGLIHNLAHRVDRFERRLIAASKRRHSDLMHDAATVRGSLFPFGRPQERTLSFIPFLARYGRKLQDAMLEQAAEHARTLL